MKTELKISRSSAPSRATAPELSRAAERRRLE